MVAPWQSDPGDKNIGLLHIKIPEKLCENLMIFLKPRGVCIVSVYVFSKITW